MAMMAAIVLAMFIIAAMAGCQYLAPQIGAAVETYCQASSPADQAALRDRVDQATAPHEVRIKCTEPEVSSDGG